MINPSKINYGNLCNHTVPIRIPPPKHKIPERRDRVNGESKSAPELEVLLVQPSFFEMKMGNIPHTMDTDPRIVMPTNLVAIKLFTTMTLSFYFVKPIR